MVCQIEFNPKPLKELKKLDAVAQKRIIVYLKSKVATQSSPRDLGKALKDNKIGLWRWGGTKQDESYTGIGLERVKLEKQNTPTKYI